MSRRIRFLLGLIQLVPIAWAPWIRADDLVVPPSGPGMPSTVFTTLLEQARVEPNAEVRSQIAATARRLPTAQALPLAREILSRDADFDDPFIPLMGWWVLEHQLGRQPEAVLRLFEERSFWDRRIVREHTLPRVMRRLAASARRADFLLAAQLLRMAPSAAHAAVLLQGFEAAFQGQPIPSLPEELVEALAKSGVGSLLLRLRQGEAAAAEEVLRLVRDPQGRLEERIRYAQALGEVRASAAVPVLLDLVFSNAPVTLRRTAVAALGSAEDPSVAPRLIARAAELPAEVRTALWTVLLNRPKWTVLWVDALEKGALSLSIVPAEIVDRLRSVSDAGLRARVVRLFPAPTAAAPEGYAERLAHVEAALKNGTANPYVGENLFLERCAGCHKLFFKGTSVGPDLTNYQRDNLGTLLLSILQPSAEIREGFRASEVETTDDRLLTGFVVEEDPQVLVLRGLDGQNVTLRRSEVKTITGLGRSLMPEGLLDGLSDQQLRDFFAFLRSSQPFKR